MDNITIAALAGIFVPILISFLKNKSWSSKVKQAVAVVVSGVVAVGITAIDNGVDLSDWQTIATNIAVVFSVAQVSYQQYFGGTALNAKLENTGIGRVSAG